VEGEFQKLGHRKAARRAEVENGGIFSTKRAKQRACFACAILSGRRAWFRFSVISIIYLFARSQPDSPVKQSGDPAFSSFFSLVTVISPFASSRMPDGTRHRSDFFCHRDYPLLSVFRFSSTSTTVAAAGGQIPFCLRCRALDRLRRGSNGF